MYDHFQKMQQLARGEGKIELTADIHCIRTSGKAACSTHPIVDIEGIAQGKNVPQQ